MLGKCSITKLYTQSLPTRTAAVSGGPCLGRQRQAGLYDFQVSFVYREFQDNQNYI